jgi:hypothetical protein
MLVVWNWMADLLSDGQTRQMYGHDMAKFKKNVKVFKP